MNRWANIECPSGTTQGAVAGLRRRIAGLRSHVPPDDARCGSRVAAMNRVADLAAPAGTREARWAHDLFSDQSPGYALGPGGTGE